MKRTDRSRDCIISLTLIISTFIISCIGIYNGHKWGGDFSQYIAQARAIDTNTVSEWFGKNSWIINNSFQGLGSVAYPWMFPILIAPIYHFFGLNFIYYQLFLSFTFAICVAAFYYLLRARRIGRKIAVLFSILLMINGEYLVLTKQILSDLPCFMFITLSLIALHTYLKERTRGNAFLVGIFGFLAFFTRSIGGVIFVSVAIVDLFYISTFRRKKKTRSDFVIVCLPYIVFIILWTISKVFLPGGGESYADFFTFNIEQCVSNLIYYFKTFGDYIFQGQLESHQWIKVLLAIICVPAIALSMTGMIKELMKLDYLAVFFIASIFVLCLFKYRQGSRYIVSLFPAFLVFLHTGFTVVSRKPEVKKVAKIMCSIACIIITSCSVMYNYKNAKCPGTNDAKSENAQKVYQYINENISDDSVIYFGKPRVLYLFTGVYSYIADDLEKETDYILRTSTLEIEKTDKILNEVPEKYEMVYSNEEFQLFKVL